MAYPQVVSRTTGGTSGDASSHTLTLPATIASGDMLLIFFGVDDNPAITWDNSTAGTWTSITSQGGTGRKGEWRYKIADGTEDGLSLSIGTDSAQQSAHCIWRITGHNSTAPAFVAAVGGTGTAPDAGNLTPSWGAKDTLWISGCVIGGSPSVTGYPTNYGQGQQAITGTGTDRCTIATAERELNATSDDAGAFTIGSSLNWYAWTIAVEPGGAGTLTDVDTDETIYTGQTSVAYTGTGLTNADGMVITTDGVNVSATAFSATNDTSGTFTAPSLSACFTAGTKFGGSVTFDIQDGGVSLATLGSGTFNAEPAYTVHTVSDTSQAGDAGCIYYWINNAGTDVANGDQIIFDNKSGNVTMDSQGFLTFAGGETQTTYRARDDTDNTWSAAWSTFTTTSAGTFVGDVVRELARDLVTDTVQ